MIDLISSKETETVSMWEPLIGPATVAKMAVLMVPEKWLGLKTGLLLEQTTESGLKKLALMVLLRVM